MTPFDDTSSASNSAEDSDRIRGVDMGGGDSSQVAYTIQSGDTLRKIAEQFYGDEMQWRKIYEANRDTIKNPDMIHAGVKIVIPVT